MNRIALRTLVGLAIIFIVGAFINYIVDEQVLGIGREALEGKFRISSGLKMLWGGVCGGWIVYALAVKKDI